MKAEVDAFQGWWLGEAAADQSPTKRLLEGPTRLSYGDVADQVARTGAWLLAAGVRPGDQVALAVAEPAHFIPLVIAMLRFGIAPMVMNPEAPAAEALALLAWLEPRAVVVDVELAAGWDLAAALPPSTPWLGVAAEPAAKPLKALLPGRRADAEHFPGVLRRFEPGPLPPPPPPEALAYVLFTSGSTSRPKGVELTHGALEAHMRTFKRRFGYAPDTRILNVLALHHTDGLFNGPLAAFACGGTLVRPFAFTLDRLPALDDLLYAERITHFVTVPTMLALMLRFAHGPGERAPDLKMITSSAATLEPRVWEGAIARYGAPVVNVYGLTETVSGSLYAGPGLSSMKIGTIGEPDDCETRILNPAGEPVGIGEEGELWLKGPHLMRGYYKNPEETAAVLVDGWFATGDLASRDADGIYRLHGRAKHVIITGGYKVAPEEVTAVLLAHPGVREAVTLGKPEPTWGEAVVAFVATDGPGATADELLAHCRARLAPYKVPTEIHHVEALPRMGATGKVRLDELRALLAQGEQERAAAGDQHAAVEAAVLALAARCFRVRPEELTPESSPRTLGGWTSLAHMGLVTALQNTFGLKFQTREIMAMKDLGATTAIVVQKVAEQAAKRP